MALYPKPATPWEIEARKKEKEAEKAALEQWYKDAEAVGFTHQQAEFLLEHFSEDGHGHAPSLDMRF